MSLETNLQLTLGRDQQYVFTVLNDAQTAAIDITGWGLSWMAKRYLSDADGAALLTKTTGAGIVISGVFNASPTLNTQVATVSVLDTDTLAIAEGMVPYEFERTDANFETPLAFGFIELIRGVQA